MSGSLIIRGLSYVATVVITLRVTRKNDSNNNAILVKRGTRNQTTMNQTILEDSESAQLLLAIQTDHQNMSCVKGEQKIGKRERRQEKRMVGPLLLPPLPCQSPITTVNDENNETRNNDIDRNKLLLWQAAYGFETVVKYSTDCLLADDIDLDFDEQVYQSQMNRMQNINIDRAKDSNDEFEWLSDSTTESTYSLSPYSYSTKSIIYTTDDSDEPPKNSIKSTDDIDEVQEIDEQVNRKDFANYKSKSISIPIGWIPCSNLLKKLPYVSDYESYASLMNRHTQEKEYYHPTHFQECQIRTYAPKIFSELRKIFLSSGDGDSSSSAFLMDEADFLKSLEGPFISFQSNSKGANRAKNIFFFSRDGCFLIKTIKKKEISQLLSMLPLYYHHMKKYSTKSLLTRFCGMYEVKTTSNVNNDLKTKNIGVNGEEMDYVFVVMNAVFPTTKLVSIEDNNGQDANVTTDIEDEEIIYKVKEKYDLKGSTDKGRRCSSNEKSRKGFDAVLKDLDLIHSFAMGDSTKKEFLDQVKYDLNFLVQCEVMDYSLLAGVMDYYNNDEGKEENIPQTVVSGGIFSSIVSSKHNNKGGVRPSFSKNGKEVYYFGIIDFLQPWDTKKILEKEYKRLIKWEDTSKISCATPKQYAKRFYEFMKDHIV